MKNIKILLIAILMGSLFSCENQDWEFPDFDYTATYFPYQYPVRTLVLGDYVFDNENDNNLKFIISAGIGGMYENNADWTVNYEVNEELVKNLLTSAGDTIRMLPTEFYTLSPSGQLVIPKGEFNAGIEVQLTEAFLNDPLAVSFNYVIPLEITSSSADSVLRGDPATENPDPRISGDWVVPPKNFTLFGIKYVNDYHGKYLHRGRSVIKNTMGEEVETIIYHSKYVVDDEVWALKTTGRREVVVNGQLRSTVGSSGNFEMQLTFDENGDCTVSGTDNSAYSVTGTGNYVKDGDEWGNKKRDAIHLNYEINDGTYLHSLTDTLVFRDKDVRFEEFEPIVVN